MKPEAKEPSTSVSSVDDLKSSIRNLYTKSKFKIIVALIILSYLYGMFAQVFSTFCCLTITQSRIKNILSFFVVLICLLVFFLLQRSLTTNL